MAWRKTSSRVGVRRVNSLTRAPDLLRARATSLMAATPLVTPILRIFFVNVDLLDLGDEPQRAGGDGSITLNGGDYDIGADGALELGGGALGDELAEVDDAYAVSQAVGFFKIVGREEYGDAEVGVDATYFFPDSGSADGVEAGGGLVEEKYFGIVDEGCGEVEPALHAAGIGADEPVYGRADVHERLEGLYAHVYLLAGKAVEASLELYELSASLLVVEGGVLEGCAYVKADLHGVGDDFITGDEGSAPGGHEEGGEHPDEGGLARAVGAEKGVDLAFGDGEVNAVDGTDAGVVAGEGLGVNGVLLHGAIVSAIKLVDFRTERGGRVGVEKVLGGGLPIGNFLVPFNVYLDSREFR